MSKPVGRGKPELKSAEEVAAELAYWDEYAKKCIAALPPVDEEFEAEIDRMMVKHYAGLKKTPLTRRRSKDDVD